MPARLYSILDRALRLAARRATAFVGRLRGDAAARERLAAAATFAFIFVFAAASVDYVITGGPDWNPGAEAQAAELPAAYAQVVPAPPPRLPDAAPSPPLAPPADAYFDPMATADDLLGGPDAVLPARYDPLDQDALLREIELLYEAPERAGAPTTRAKAKPATSAS
jgi:hypothetical protein